MDVHGARYATFDDLVGYCRRFAGSVGRLSLGVFGTDEPAEAEPQADALGVALQLTNILRDIATSPRTVTGWAVFICRRRTLRGSVASLTSATRMTP
jgi:hypothetical protein